MTIDAALLERHGLKRDEYDRIVKALGREPSITELGIFSVMWSEHCSYKSSRIHLKKLPTNTSASNRSSDARRTTRSSGSSP